MQCVIIEIVAIVQELRFRPCCTVHVVRSFAKDADRGLLQVRPRVDVLDGRAL